jgi:hypothetical protein
LTAGRAWATRAAAATLLAATAVGVLGTPGFADDTVQVSAHALGAFGPGQSRTLHVQIVHPTLSNDTETLKVAVAGLGRNFTIARPQGCTATGTSSCTVDFVNGATGTKRLSFTITASGNPNLRPGQTDNHAGSIRVTQIGGEFRATVSFHAVLHNPQPASPAPDTADPTANLAGTDHTPTASGVPSGSGIGLATILFGIGGGLVLLAVLGTVLALVGRRRDREPEPEPVAAGTGGPGYPAPLPQPPYYPGYADPYPTDHSGQYGLSYPQPAHPQPAHPQPAHPQPVHAQPVHEEQPIVDAPAYQDVIAQPPPPQRSRQPEQRDRAAREPTSWYNPPTE